MNIKSSTKSRSNARRNVQQKGAHRLGWRFQLAYVAAMSVFVLAMMFNGLALGDGDKLEWEDGDLSYDQARRAVSRGDVLPVERLLERVQEQMPGQVLELEFEREDGRWVYEIKVIDSDGRLLDAYFDAKNGDLISVDGG